MQGARALAACLPATLEALSLVANEISGEGCKAIAAGLPSAPALAMLTLSDNQINDYGAKASSSTRSSEW